MKDKPNDMLLLAGKILTIFMQAAMAIAAAALVLAIPLILFFQDKITVEARAEYGEAIGAFPALTTAGVLALALATVALVFFFFGKLRAIIGTVGEGDPFVPENAERLSLMAWLLLAVQVLMIPIGGLALIVAKWADQLDHSNITVDAGLDLEGILMVIVLFILARVFKHGADMRADLEGTV